MDSTRRHFLWTTATLIPAPALLHAALFEDAAGASRNSFLTGNFGPVREEITADNLKVIGDVPRELDGMFVRNGPNPQFNPPGRYHWFDGDGMLHGVRLRDGKASYRNRYVRTPGWQEEHQANKALYGGLMDPPTPQFRQGKLQFKTTANTAVVWHDGQLLALVESGLPHAVKLPSLDTIGPQDFKGKLKHAFTAHPKTCPKTGELLFFGYNLMAKPFLRYGVISPVGEILHATAIDLPRPIMMHDFAITANHAVFLDLPEVFDLARAFKGEFPLKFEPERGARIGVLPRRGEGKDIKWFSVDPCYVFHTLNAWEEDDEIHLFACRMKRFPDDFLGGQTDAGGVLKDTSPLLYRWRLNLKTGKAREEVLDDISTDFPRVNDNLQGLKTRYGYAARAGGEMFTGLRKYDLELGRTEEHRYGPGRFGGEGVFVPRANAKAEDDGWLLNYVFDKAENRSELVIVDAIALRDPPLARVQLPTRVPYGFHGTWVSARQFGAG